MLGFVYASDELLSRPKVLHFTQTVSSCIFFQIRLRGIHFFKISSSCALHLLVFLLVNCSKHLGYRLLLAVIKCLHMK